HESLRTTFALVDGVPVQIISESFAVPLPVVDLSLLADPEREQEARRLRAEERAWKFDLTRGPLFRAKLLRLQEEEDLLLLTLHHIVTDGWSQAILARELRSLYQAFEGGLPSPLSELSIQYVDYAAWQREWLQGEVLQKQIAYWKQQLADAPPLLTLP